MEERDWKKLLTDYKEGTVSQQEVLLKLKEAPYEDLGFARVDHHRGLRQGAAEVVYGAGKLPEEILAIAKAQRARGERTILLTRLSEEASEALKAAFPEDLHLEERSGTAILGEKPQPDGIGRIVIVTGGTSDIPVAEEAAWTAEALGNEVLRLYDAGVAGIHRLFDHLEELMSASVVIAIAGMEGALPSVVGGLVDCPVIAVPTSVGYGASFGGMAALLAMLNSCASGISVVNIDNGFGAGYQASMINHVRDKRRKEGQDDEAGHL